MFRNVFVVLLQLLFFSFGGGTSEEPQETWKVAENWPKYDSYGQISAVSVDTNGYIYVFHRGNHVWDYSTFSYDNIYQFRKLGPISNETIIVLNPEDGSVKFKTGSRMFYMPHGLTVDHMDNIWITDVAMHQVFKFPPLNMSKNGYLSRPEITLGQEFQPGNDFEHFCKPTDVAVDKTNGDFYVSDGYCNYRIIKYDKFGTKLLSWGRSPHGEDHFFLNVPHALALAVDENMLFVADRENHRALAYSTPTGTFKQKYQDKRAVYSVAYSSVGGKHLFTLTNASYQYPGVVTVYNIEDQQRIGLFSPWDRGFSNPHDLAVSPDGKCCYVVELNPTKVWKFKLVSSDNMEESKLASEDLKVKESEERNLISKSEAHDSAHDFLGGTLLAVGVVSAVVVITFLIFVFHMYKKKVGYAQYEMRRLILDDEDEVGINVP